MFLSFSIFSFAQVTGRVLVENSVPASSVLVINIKTDAKTYTNSGGKFSLAANPGDEIRFVKNGYERKSVIVTSESIGIVINLNASIRQIEEVKVNKITGDLSKDSKSTTQEKNTQMNVAVKNYIKIKPDPAVLARKGGDFVQPKGEGFSIGKIHNKWDKTDFYYTLIDELGANYFENLGVSKVETESFIRFALKDFDDKVILKYGRYSSSDLAKIAVVFEDKILKYRNLKAIPN